MKPSQFSSLTAKQVEIIEQLTAKWSSQRDIAKITGHGRMTIRKYQRIYLERKRLALKLEKALDKYYANTKVYNIHYWFIWLVLLSIIWLSSFWIYFLINLK